MIRRPPRSTLFPSPTLFRSVQWSAASLSHAPPCELPVHSVADDLKTSVGQVPLDPVQFSATSHWPAEPRHTVALDWKTSTHTLLVPVQWSAPSHAPPPSRPVPVDADDANPPDALGALVPDAV